VRATLAAAVAAGVVGGATADLLLARVKSTFYAGRALVAALDRGNAEHERLRAWLSDGRVERKREDAFELLDAMRRDLDEGFGPLRPAWTLQRTRYWEEARRSIELAGDDDPGPTPETALDALLDEVRLDRDAYARLADRSLLTALARSAAAAAGVDVSPWAHEAAVEEERRALGLLEPEDLDTWLEGHGLDRADLPEVARRLAVLRWARDAHRDAVAGEMALALRSDDTYAQLAGRAERKRDAIASLPSDRATPGDEKLIGWYFRERLGREVPVALDAWATANGWRHVAELVRALRSEWWFVSSLDP
jgi:hypothetical protein